MKHIRLVRPRLKRQRLFSSIDWTGPGEPFAAGAGVTETRGRRQSADLKDPDEVVFEVPDPGKFDPEVYRERFRERFAGPFEMDEEPRYNTKDMFWFVTARRTRSA